MLKFEVGATYAHTLAHGRVAPSTSYKVLKRTKKSVTMECGSFLGETVKRFSITVWDGPNGPVECVLLYDDGVWAENRI